MGAQIIAALVVVALLLGGAFSPSLGASRGSHVGSRSTPLTFSISVAATGNYGYQPSTIQEVPTNTTINVTFTDESDLAHTFTIIGKEGWVIPDSYTAAQIDNLGYGKTPAALFNANVSGDGDVATGAFQSPGPGWYEFVCTVSGHFQNGMYGFIAFGEDLPSNLTTPNRVGIGGPISPLEAAAGGGVVILAVLGFVLWRRRRSGPRVPLPSRETSTTPPRGGPPR